ncbi:MAG: alpha-2-macroglobulin family protein [Bacteroidota bacterium]
MPIQFDNNPYLAEWKVIDSLEKEGLPKSALAKVDQLYQRAKADNADAQMVKCLIYQAKYQTELGEKGLSKAIANVEGLIDSADFPQKQLLQSIAAELYDGYLMQNYWRFSQRTQTLAAASDDMETWTTSQFLDKIHSLYWTSVDDKALQDISISDFDAITTGKKDNDALRPSLYDFLAHRALDFFINDRSFLTEPIYKFYIDEPKAIGSAEEFLAIQWSTLDTFSSKYNSLRLLQDLMNFHKDDDDPIAFIDADLKRLQFVWQYSIIEDKDRLYKEALEGLRQRHNAHPSFAEITAKLARAHFDLNEQKELQEQSEKNTGYPKAHELCQEAIERFPDSYGAKSCRSLLKDILSKDLLIKTELVNIPGQPIRALIQYRNVSTAHFRLVSISRKERLKLTGMKYDALRKYLTSLTPLESWTEELPGTEDFGIHRVEFKVEAQGVGEYLLLVSDNKGFRFQSGAVAYLNFHVSNIAYLQRRDEQQNKLLYLTDRTTGQPLQGVTATFFTQEYDRRSRQSQWRRLGTKTSDAKGIISTSSVQSRNLRVEFDYKEDRLALDNRISNYPSINQQGGRKVTHFFTDRMIYRPGQTLYFKALLLEMGTDQMPRILPNEEIRIVLRDANWQEVEKIKLKSNAYGTVSGSFTLPSSGLLGAMTLSSLSTGHQKSVRVEEYKRPKFELTFEKLTGSYRLGDQVTLVGQAKAFSGSNVDGAMVQYHVSRTVRYPYLPWQWYRRGFNPSGGRRMEIINGTAKTDENGRFEVTFELRADPTVDKNTKPEFLFEVHADVTDITGETQSNQTSLRAGYIALDLGFDPGERLHRDSLKKLNIKSFNLSGEPAVAKGSLRIERLKAPERPHRKRLWPAPDQYLMSQEAFVSAFPLDPYKEEHLLQNFPVQDTQYDQAFSINGDGSIEINPATWPTAYYKATIQAEDQYGTPIELIRYFHLYDLEEKEMNVPELDFFVSQDRAYEPGENCQIYFNSSEPLYVLYEVYHQRKIQRQEWLRVNDLQELQLAIQEKHRGNLHYSLSFFWQNRAFVHKQRVRVPWTNKELSITYETFRDKLLPGQKEEWRIKISGPKKETVAAEVVAALYDASLDQFAANRWSLNLYPIYSADYPSAGNNVSLQQSAIYADDWQPSYSTPSRSYRMLNWFGFDQVRYRQRVMSGEASPMMSRSRSNMKFEHDADVEMEEAADEEADPVENSPVPPPPPVEEAEPEAPVKVRTNLKETVFFFPDLMTDEQGNVILRFTMNEALTRWKFLTLAHTKDLEVGTSTNEVVTQKELMVVPNPPRFMREGDELEFTAKVSNLTEDVLKGTAKLQLFDALSMQPVDQLLGNTRAELPFEAKAGQSARLSWTLKIPVGKVLSLTHRVVAQADRHADGEESSLPILTNRMLVTETMPLPVKGGEKKTFEFARMKEAAASNSLQHHRLTLEYTSNPAWYAVQSLPYLMEYPYNCTEQIFSRYYANSLAASAANAHPKIQRVFEQWKNTPALESNLSKNQELKSALLEETPWVLQAQSEAQQKKRIGLLFDLNRMSYEAEQSIGQLVERQSADGGFAWFPGGRSNWYISQYLVEGMGHLDQLGVQAIRQDERAMGMLRNAVRFIDEKVSDRYEKLQERAARNQVDLSKDHLDRLVIHYLYSRSFFQDLPMDAKTQAARDYYLGQAEKYWLGKGIYSEGMLALALHRYGRQQQVEKMLASFRERALSNEEMGTYWKYSRGYYWHELPIETHALMIELFDEVAKDDKMVESLKIWLLKRKQTTHWKTTKATAAAVYALLKRGDNWLLEDQKVDIRLGEPSSGYAERIQMAQGSAEAGTGYFKTAWSGREVSTDMARVEVDNPNQSIAWGAMYWQYFEQLDKITSFEETPLQLKKELFVERRSDRGAVLDPVKEGQTLKVGDKLKVRIELRVDRDMEYVHMKDMRASGLEPINVLSRYKWQEGLGYYESTRDASTNFFFSYLPKGTYVFEYPLRVVHNGDFSNGLTSIQSMYAPEFSSHSEGVRLKVDP